MLLQKLIKSILPKNLSDKIEAESRSWMVQCPNCKYERSYWDMGGLRWGAAGNPKINKLCSNCHTLSWHIVYKKVG